MSVVHTQQVIDGDVRETAWKLYSQAFEDLRHMAVQRHLMFGGEFDAVMVDEKVDKFMVWGEDRSLLGLSTMTTYLPSMPLISPDYFERRWPDRYAAGQIYYIGFLAVHPDSHGTGIFGEMVKAMTEPVAAIGGLAVLDVCSYNKDRLHLPRAICWLASTWAPAVKMSELDAQTFMAYDFARG